MQAILRKSELTVGELQMQVAGKTLPFLSQKHQTPGLTKHLALQDIREGPN